jgi:hypothetical protein
VFFIIQMFGLIHKFFLDHRVERYYVELHLVELIIRHIYLSLNSFEVHILDSLIIDPPEP